MQEILDWFAASHSSFMVELARWQVLPPQSVALVQSFSHVPSMPVCGGLLEPGAQAVALLAAQGDTTEVLSLTNVPRKQRAALLDAVQSGVLLPPSAPTPTATPRAAAELVPRLAVSSWSQTARQEAEACGLGFIPPAYLSDLDGVPPADVPSLAEQAGWQLQNTGRYALLRCGDCVLLLRQPDGASAATVLRCSRLEGLA